MLRAAANSTGLVVLGLLLLVGSCSARTYAPVKERGSAAPQPDAPYREVRAGETLYSIAWDAGRDYRELAAWNDIDPPYVIHPGQRLRLQPPAIGRKPPRGSSHSVAKGETLYGIARSRGLRYQDLALWNGIAPPYTVFPGQQLRLSPPGAEASAAATGRNARGTEARSTAASRPAGEEPLVWSWPTDGAIVARFAASGSNKGIDIAGNAGQPIRAAAPGEVVYEGSGLRGYGQLIIVKHNAEYLSAYAHCAATYVREGSVIKAGQKIAEMGSTGTDRTKLHFEIRRRGIPVDPLEFLPKK